MPDSVDRFVEEAPRIASAETISKGDYIHVYRGQLDGTGQVRILSIAPDITDSAIHDAFERTADRWQNPSTHPNIVTVHDRGTRPRPWLAVEDVDGERLDEVRADLSMAEIGKVVSDSAEAIRNANLYNTVHSALAPDIIWVIRRDGGLIGQVDDWGLERTCRVAAGETPLSEYSAPELADSPGSASEQTDVYGLGAIAFYALTGQPPSEAAEGRLADALEAENITRPSELNSSVTAEVDEMILKALARSPTDRHQSSYEFRNDLVEALPTSKQLDALDVDTIQQGSTSRQSESGLRNEDTSEQTTSTTDQTDGDTTATTGQNEMWGSESTSMLSRRTILAGVGLVGLGAIGWRVASSNSGNSEPSATTPEDTPTPPPEDTPTPPPEDTPTPPPEDTPTPPPEDTAPADETDWIPMFQADAANTGHRSPGSGPTVYLTEKWVFRTSTGIVSSPFVADGTVYVGSNNGHVYAVDESDGTEQWSYETGDAVQSSPAVVEETVYIGSHDGNLHALDAEEGFKEWDFQTRQSIHSSPAVVDGSVYVGGDDGNLYSINMSDGTEEWSFETRSTIRTSPAVVDGLVFFGNDDQKVYAIDAEDGTAQWDYGLGGRIRSSPVVADDTVYLGCQDTRLYALATTRENIGSNRLEWTFQAENRIFSSPAVGNGKVFFGSGRIAHAVDASDGTEEWSFGVSGEILSSPSVGSRTVYLGCNQEGRAAGNNTVYGIDTEDGTETTRFAIPGDIRSSPAIGEETIYLGGARSNLYALTEGT